VLGSTILRHKGVSYCLAKYHYDSHANLQSGPCYVVGGVSGNDIFLQKFRVCSKERKLLGNLCDDSLKLGNRTLGINLDFVLDSLCSLTKLECGYRFFDVKRVRRASDEEGCLGVTSERFL
jgi:hypothetical protein